MVERDQHQRPVYKVRCSRHRTVIPGRHAQGNVTACPTHPLPLCQILSTAGDGRLILWSLPRKGTQLVLEKRYCAAGRTVGRHLAALAAHHPTAAFPCSARSFILSLRDVPSYLRPFRAQGDVDFGCTWTRRTCVAPAALTFAPAPLPSPTLFSSPPVFPHQRRCCRRLSGPT